MLRCLTCESDLGIFLRQIFNSRIDNHKAAGVGITRKQRPRSWAAFCGCDCALRPKGGQASNVRFNQLQISYGKVLMRHPVQKASNENAVGAYSARRFFVTQLENLSSSPRYLLVNLESVPRESLWGPIRSTSTIWRRHVFVPL